MSPLATWKATNPRIHASKRITNNAKNIGFTSLAADAAPFSQASEWPRAGARSRAPTAFSRAFPQWPSIDAGRVLATLSCIAQVVVADFSGKETIMATNDNSMIVGV